MVAKSAKPAEVSFTPREPTDRDKAAIAFASERVTARRRRASVHMTGTDATVAVHAPHSDGAGHQRQMLDAFGTSSFDFMESTLGTLINALSERSSVTPSAVVINGALAMMSGSEPANEVEALLASQMAATHALAMTLIGRTRRAEHVPQLEANGGLAIKLLRTFTLQAEALAKLRRGGGQTVRVEHVHVHPGGQAIVGNVAAGGGAPMKSEEQPHAKPVAALAHADAPFKPLWSTDAERERVPIARHA